MSISSNFASIYIDGGSRGNPGPAGAGIIIETNIKNYNFSIPLGQQTNNYAEYEALLFALKKAGKLKLVNLTIYSDSELLVNQMKGIYKVKSHNLINSYEKAKKLSLNFKNIKFIHIPREKNKEADELANIAMDKV